MTERGTYRVIAAQLEERIKSGDLGAGAMLPSEPALASEYGVARNTVRSALDLLAESGLIEVLPGQGRRVVGRPAPGTSSTAYERVAASLRAAIDSGQFASGLPLPSEAQLQTEHSVSRNTIRRAYRLLEAEGTIVIRHGAGAFIAPKADGATQPSEKGR